VLEWDVDSFDGLEDYSSLEVLFSSDEEPFSEEAVQHYCLFKRQMIESKVRPTSLIFLSTSLKLSGLIDGDFLSTTCVCG